ncbi:tRNA-dihydrouridine synthase 1 [Ceratobasidium sp. AG-Ba]|nr:tRNA-dihydrouridine synthase 1 [Ceratobasidium sp. AG-Ba]QRW11827.1 tRNA-dihydrouridine synthase 1 [Ceratobasidium sp. AG-Ba]
MATSISAESGTKPWPPGTARIKSKYAGMHGRRRSNTYRVFHSPLIDRYLIGDPFTTQKDVPPPDDDAAEGSTSQLPQKRSADTGQAAETKEDDGQNGGNDENEPAQKKQRLPPSERKRLAKEKRKEQRGANKSRKFARVQDEIALCHGSSRGEGCIDGDRCRFSHNIPHYLATKAADIAFPPSDSLSITEPFVAPHKPTPLLDSHSYLDGSARCPNFACSSRCQSGFKCRFLGSHVVVQKSEDGGYVYQLVKDDAKYEQVKDKTLELNYPAPGLQKQLRTHKYPTPIADAYLDELSRLTNDEKNTGQVIEPPLEPPKSLSLDELEAQKDTPDVPIRASEKRQLRWQGMSYLAPLTTPFRRLCASFGAQITCSEMALASSLLQGTNSELSLVRRHPIEKIFGVQIAGGKLPQLVRAAEMLKTEFGPNNGRERAQVDFVDVNCGCPIDMVFNTGAGSALLENHNKLGRILIGMSRALGEVPLTIKVRTGIKEGRNTTHKLMPRLSRWGVNAFSIHGRTRQQRYSRLADWDYIKECVEALRASTEDDDLPTIPIFGGGDVFSAEQYWTNVEQTGVDGIMVGRGALIKPWIFTEIAERREWDISSRERLDMIRHHWGSDTMGVNNTRRFLCEALSFTYRYIPIGLLERLPGKINERAPAYHSRDDLETLLASNKSSDWVKISEMFLGRAPEGWTFVPKHKSNAQGGEEANG